MNTTELIARLKAAAQKAKWGDWEAYKPHKGSRGYEVKCGVDAVAQHCLKAEAEYIAKASPKVVLALVEALESAQRKIAELESRAVTVRLPVTFWYEHDDLSRDVAVLDKRLVKKAIRDACERAGIKCEVKGE